MNITTKFQPGDDVWRMHSNAVQQARIIHMEIHVRPALDKPHVSITYILEGDSSLSERREFEDTVFATKAELLASL